MDAIREAVRDVNHVNQLDASTSVSGLAVPAGAYGAIAGLGIDLR